MYIGSIAQAGSSKYMCTYKGGECGTVLNIYERRGAE